MKRINVSLYDETYTELETRTIEKKCGSIAQSIRELIDLGMRIEKAATQNNAQENTSNDLSHIMEILKNTMRLTVESLLISRQMLVKFAEENPDKAKSILKDCKEEANNHVRKMFHETGEIIN